MGQAFSSDARHAVAVVGAAVAGSEVARILASRGAAVVVIEQNRAPYGKIEDGLPRWHVQQRLDEYRAIDARLSQPGIEYLPLTGLGRDISFDELVSGWGLSAVVLCHGAWRDRPLPVPGADQFVGRGLVYQNSFIYWFNHYWEPGYSGPQYEPLPRTLVVGGGLASLDVVKVLQIETTLRALAARGVKEDMVRLEREGLEPALAAHGLRWAELDIAPCKLIYRRTVLDMPLSDIDPAAGSRRVELMRQARAKILDKARRKYLFDFEQLRLPSGLLVENSRLTGLLVSRTEVVGTAVKVVPDSEERLRAPMVISSIGSTPEPIEGIAQKGEVYRFLDPTTGLLSDGPTAVFAAGNVLTGKGNIKDSLDNATFVGTHVAERYLGLVEGALDLGQAERERAAAQGERIAAAVAGRVPLPAERVRAVAARVRERQRAVGYDGDYRAWIARAMPGRKP
jgi:NADPH-dependent glutamate synthase beta subunit-like oxidoreductase